MSLLNITVFYFISILNLEIMQMLYPVLFGYHNVTNSNYKVFDIQVNRFI